MTGRTTTATGLVDGADPDVPDVDGDGENACLDCDDTNPALNHTDVDGDGVDTCSNDCDDGDPRNYPGNQEVCDGQDNDCDRLVDGADPDVPDADGDGENACLDCDDTNPALNHADVRRRWCGYLR